MNQNYSIFLLCLLSSLTNQVCNCQDEFATCHEMNLQHVTS